jgi:hypothetical protein
MRYIDVNDSEEVLRALRLTDEEVPLDIILHTPGAWYSLPCRSLAQSAIANRRSQSSCRIMQCPAGH